MLINNLFFADLGVPEGWPTSGKDKIIQDRAREGGSKNELTTYFASGKALISRDLDSNKRCEKLQTTILFRKSHLSSKAWCHPENSYFAVFLYPIFCIWYNVSTVPS